ncbi:MAG: hypothetical protein EXS05_21680 [Planctomycetaceae bacterium]|nr:hypothetical protein [Planctomycetaceae bacterium]
MHTCNSPGAARLVDELRDFPFGDHDEGPDPLEMAVRLAEGLPAVPANDPGFTVERAWTGSAETLCGRRNRKNTQTMNLWNFEL